MYTIKKKEGKRFTDLEMRIDNRDDALVIVSKYDSNIGEIKDHQDVYVPYRFSLSKLKSETKFWQELLTEFPGLKTTIKQAIDNIEKANP